MRTLSGAALLSMSLVFLLTGLVLLSWEILSLVIPMALLLYLSYALARPPELHLECSRLLDAERVEEGEVVRVTLCLRNLGTDVDYLEVEDQVPQGMEMEEGRAAFPIRLRRGEVATIHYSLRPSRRGYYEYGGTRVTWTDATMLSSRSSTLEAKSRIVVLPKVQDLRRCELTPHRLRFTSGNFPSPSLGPGSEFYCLRDYDPGDQRRFVNWKASARRGKLLVNDFQIERPGDMVLLLDARTGLSDSKARSQLLDQEVDAAMSLASHFLRQRDRVGLLLLAEVFDVVPLASGKRQYYRLFDRLLSTRSAFLRPTEGIAMALDRYFPTSRMVLAITSLEDDGIISSLKGLGRRGYDVIVLSPDWYGLEQIDPSKGAVLAGRMHRVRRSDKLAELGKYFRVVDLDQRTSLAKYLREGRTSSGRR